MKENYYFRGVCILLIIATVVSISCIFFPRSLVLGGQYKVLYDPLENNISVIKTNMDEITVSNNSWDWAKLKNTNLDDKKLENTYTLLVSDIRTCYLLSTDLKNKVYKNLKVLSFKNKRSVSNKEIKELAGNGTCLKNFNKYNSMTLSDDQRVSERVKNQISIIIDYEPDLSTAKTFYDVLKEESITMDKIASLTEWLKVEYYSNRE